MKLSKSQIEDVVEFVPKLSAEQVLRLMSKLPRPIPAEIQIALEDRIGEPSAKLRERLISEGARLLLRSLVGT